MREMEAFARALLDARRAGRRFAPEGEVPRTAAQAYAVQRRVMEAIGPPAAFKTARRPGAAAIMAPIAAEQLFASGAAVPLGGPVGVELEIALEAVAAVPAGTPAAALLTLMRPRAAIELVDTRIEGPLADDPMVKLADQQACGALILGPPAEWDGDDLREVAARLVCGDATVLDGPAAPPGGSALEAVAAFLAMDEVSGGLRPGQVVITGSLNGLPRFPPRTRVRGEIGGLGAVEAVLG